MGPSGNRSTCNPVSNSTCTDTAHYTYNFAAQVTSISYTDGTPDVTYAYDPSGQLCWMYEATSVSSNPCTTPPTGSTTYTYDSLGRLIETTNAAGATIAYGYDSQSRLDCVVYPNTAGSACSSSGNPTGVVRYTYNSASQLQSITDWAGNTFTFEYNSDGQQCWVSTSSSTSCSSVPSSGVSTAYSYDAAGNASDIKTTSGSTTLLDLAVGTRSPDEYIEAETPTIGTTANNTDNYTYNSSNQVASGPIVGTTGSRSYSYTTAGGITADTTSFSTASYDQAGVLCWTLSGTSSNACSSTPSGGTGYSTNSDGERTSMTPPSGNPASYAWDTESGLLVCANTNGTTCSTSSPTSSTTLYSYDGNGLRTSAKIGSTTTSFTWGTLSGSPSLLSDGTWDYVYDPGSPTPLEQIAPTGSSPTTDELLSDENGNVRGLVQLSSGTHQDQLVNYTDYDAYGGPITEDKGSLESGGLTTSHTALNSNWVGTTPWGFGSGYTDPTGLLFLLHRYYDPVSAQLLSVDPALNLSESPYSYASDNPANSSDPSGLLTLGFCANAEIGVNQALTLGSKGIDKRVAECLVTDSTGGVGFGSIHDAKESAGSYELPHVGDIVASLFDDIAHVNVGLFAWTSPLTSIMQLNCEDCREFSYSDPTAHHGEVHFAKIHDSKDFAKYSLLTGYSKSAAVGEAFPYSWSRVDVNVFPATYDTTPQAGSLIAAAVFYSSFVTVAEGFAEPAARDR